MNQKRFDRGTKTSKVKSIRYLPAEVLQMDKDEARQKEAERTLKRIKSTLHHLEDGSAWEDSITEKEEIKRMRRLIESGYSHDNTGPLNWLSTVVKRPVFIALLIVIMLVVAEFVQR